MSETISGEVIVDDDTYQTFIRHVFGIDGTGIGVDKITIDRVIFNGPATIIIWKNGDKTVVKCHDGDTYDNKVGFMYACTKRICELGGFGKPSKGNAKPFDSWMNAWCGRKATCYDNTQRAGK